MKRQILALLFGWYVVTYSGQKFAGPFGLITDCNEEAARLSHTHYNISTVCKHFSD
jgi:hypothetical protein